MEVVFNMLLNHSVLHSVLGSQASLKSLRDMHDQLLAERAELLTQLSTYKPQTVIDAGKG
jgi:hypothetical protein